MLTVAHLLRRTKDRSGTKRRRNDMRELVGGVKGVAGRREGDELDGTGGAVRRQHSWTLLLWRQL